MSASRNNKSAKQRLSEAMLLWALFGVFTAVMAILILTNIDRPIDTGLRFKGTVSSCDDTHRRLRHCEILIADGQIKTATVLANSAMQGDSVTLRVLKHRLSNTTEYVLGTTPN